MQRLSRSLSRLETQDIKTQPQINHDLISNLKKKLVLDLGQSLMSESNRGVTVSNVLSIIFDLIEDMLLCSGYSYDHSFSSS